MYNRKYTQVSSCSICEGSLILPSIQYQLIPSESISKSAGSTREPYSQGKEAGRGVEQAVKLDKSTGGFFSINFFNFYFN